MNENVGSELAEVALDETQTTQAAFDEVAVLFLGKRAVRAGEQTELADHRIDLLIAGIDAEFFFRGPKQDAAGEEVFVSFFLRTGISGETVEEAEKLPVARLGKRLGELVAGIAKLADFTIGVGFSCDFQNRDSATRSLLHGARIHQDESDDNKCEEDNDEDGVFTEIFDHGARAGRES